jgi:transglutaminase-like putative cysteine protease
MLIRYGFRLSFDVPQSTPLVSRLDVHPERQADVVDETDLSFTAVPAPPPILDTHGNPTRRMLAPSGRSILELSGVIRDPGLFEPQLANEPLWPVSDLPDDALLYLLPSRYCESDNLSGFAWKRFGHLPPDARRITALVNYVHNRLTFGYPFARSNRTGAEALKEGVGVCRDFAHATIALCRALNIPARYVNGYLGDIGVPRDPAPMDFSAWVEVFVGGRWFTIDARHNRPRKGRIVIARGRDATDVPLIHTFGPHALQEFKVVTDEVQEGSDKRIAA